MNEITAFPRIESRTSSIKIAMVAPNLEILGGQGVQAKGLTQALRDEGHEVVFVPVNPRFPAGLRWLRRIPVLRTLLNQLLYIPGLYRLRHADVVHVFSASYWSFLLAPVPAILAARLFGKRVILNYHSGEAKDHLAHWGIGVHPWLHMVDEIAVPSEYLGKIFSFYGYRTKVIRNLVDTTSFRYRPRNRLRPRLLSVRNLESHYGIDNTLRAFAIVKRKRPDADLTIAGYGSEEERLKACVHDLGLEDVYFVGRVEPDDVPALYDAADIFVNSSRIDNQPLSILEAFASGINVVSTPTGDIAAMIRDGITGRIVPQDDPQAMAGAILRLLGAEEQAAEMARRARDEVEKYTWRHVRRKWEQLYMKEDA